MKMVKRLKKHKNKIALGMTGFLIFVKILTLNVGENILHQFIGASVGITVETILLSVVFAVILWTVIKNG